MNFEPTCRVTALRRLTLRSTRAAVRACVAAALLSLSALPALAAGTFYVDTQHPAANNNNPGTEALPYKTITGAAAARNGPGTVIIVKPGTYRETLTVPASGALGNHYIFQTSGPGVVVDGADDFSGTSKWALSSGTVYRAASVNWSTKQVFVNGVRLTPSTAAPASLPLNSFVYVGGSSGGLYVNIGGANPGAHATLVGRRTYGIRLSARSYVTIQGFTVARTEDRAIYVTSGSNNNILRANAVTNAYRYGIALNGSTGTLVEQNVVSNTQDHGIALTASSTACTVQDNESFNNAHPTVRQANGIYLNRSTNNLLQRNRLHHNQDSGLQQNTSSDNNSSIQNISWSNGDHGFDNLNSANSTIIGCVAYGNYKNGFSIEGNSPGARLQNSIAIDNGINVLPADGPLETDLWVDSQSSVGFVSDYNLFWNSTSQAPVKYISTSYSTVAAYSAATGHDSHSLQSNPTFTNPASGNFELLPLSPAVDAAHSGIPDWPATDALGRVRVDDPGVPNTGVGSIAYADRGALEFQATGALPVAALTVTPSSGPAPLTVSLDASGSSSPNGAITSYRFNLGDGTIVGPQASPQTSHTYAAGTWTATVTVTDVIGYTDSESATVSSLIVDLPPVVTAPAAVSVNENQLLTVNVTAADPNNDAITLLAASNMPAGATFVPGAGNTSGTLSWTPAFDQAGSWTVTFTASNALSGAASTAITVDNVDRSPVVGAPATLSGDENASLEVVVSAADPDGDAITSLTATGVPTGATFTPGPGNTSGTLNWTPDFTQSGVHTVTFTASNALSGASATSITVSNVDRAPLVSAPATASGDENSTITVNVTVSDPDGDAITSLTASDLPLGATFAPGAGNTSGTLSWTPDFDQSGTYAVTFSAGNALSGSAGTSLTVNNVDRAPTVTAPPSASVLVGSLLTVEVTAVDSDGDPIASLTATTLPLGATFTPGVGNTSGTLSWTPGSGDAGDHLASFTASNVLTGSANTLISVSAVDRPPVVSAPASAGGRALETLTFAVSAADPDGQAIVSLEATVLPAGATFTPGPDNSTGTFSWTPVVGDVGEHSVTFTATNTLSGSASTTLTVAPADQAPVVTAPATTSVNENQALSVALTVADPDGDPITSLTTSELPAGASFTPGAGNTTGTLSWIPDHSQSGSYSVTFTASNALSGSASISITVDNVDRAPVVTAPASAAGNVGSTITVNVTTSDPDGDAITSLVASGAPTGASFTPGPNNTDGTLSWTPAAGDVGEHSVTFTATNALSGSATTTLTVAPADQAPVVTAPPAASVNENQALSVNVTASDPNGDAITSLTASGLPTGASFAPGPGNTSGTLSWIPDHSQSGSYTVVFTATNALAGSSSTSITVNDVDRSPVVVAPAATSGRAGTTITVNVTASDPDGDPLTSITAGVLPSGANFTPGPGNTSGTLTWTPGAGDVGNHSVTFTATNALSGDATTVITVLPPNQLPVAALTATPSTGNDPILTTADATGSVDPDGSIVTYGFDFGDGFVVGPQASPVSPAHSYAAGSWTLTVMVTDNDGGTGTRSVPILVAAVPSQPNLVGNPSFETNSTGWGSYSGGVLARIAGGFDGGWGLQITGGSTTASFGCNDSPNWVASVPAAGTKYRFTAWVRSVAHLGTAKLQVREYLGSTKTGSIYSSGVPLTSNWQPVTVDYITVSSGSTLDFQVIDFPVVGNEVFVTDNISIRNVTGTGPALLAGNDARQPGTGPESLQSDLEGRVPLRGALSPSPLRSRSTLTFVTTRAGSLVVELYEITGRRARVLMDQSDAPAGLHRIPVDTRDDGGGALSPGVYFYLVRAAEGRSTGRFVYAP